MVSKVVIAASIAVSIAIAAPASAATLWNGTGATDTVSLAQFGPAFTSVSSGTAFTSTNGLTGTLTTGNGTDVERRDQGSSWAGNFTDGATLLWNRDTAGDLTFLFNTAVQGVGAHFQTDFYGDFTAQLTLSDGSTVKLPGNSQYLGAPAIFIGAQDSVADIVSVTFHQLDGSGNNGFAISNLSVLTGTSAVPEPASWAMMIFGLALAGAALRRRSGATRTTVRFA